MNISPELALDQDPVHISAAPTPEQVRNLLLNGAEAYEKKYPEPTAQQLVDTFMAERRLTESKDKSESIDQLPPDDFDWSANKSVVLREQPATAVYWNDFGQLIIRQQKAWDEENDHVIFISQNNASEFLDRLCYVMGVGSFGGPQ